MSLSKILILSGLFLLITGLALYFFGNKFNWFGNLPIDYKYKSKNIKIFAPIGSMLLISIVLSITLNLLNKFFK